MAIKYSFIVPFYNVQDYLAECLDSLIGFDRTDYEIILINDGSQDKSKVIATEYMSRYSMIKMIEQENQGLGGARNTGIRHAKGEWLLFVDSDDYVSDTLLDAVDKHIAKLTPDDIMVLNFSYLYENGEIIPECPFSKTIPVTEISKAKFYSVPVTACGKVFHKNFFSTHHIEYPRNRYYEDIAVFLKIMLRTKNLLFVDAPLYIYRQRSTSITKSRNLEKMYDMVQDIEEQVKYFIRCGQYRNYQKEIEYYAVLHILLEVVPWAAEQNPHSGYLKKMCRYMNKRFPNFEHNPYLKKLSPRNRIYLKLIIGNRFVLLNYLIKIKRTMKALLEKMGLKMLIKKYKEIALNRL